MNLSSHLLRPLPLLLLVPLLLLAATPAALTVNISNIDPRRDQTGAIIDAHDGNVVYDAASRTYFYFAAGYGRCREPDGLNGCSMWCNDCACGFYFNHSVNLYSTQDLVHWTSHGNVLPLGEPRPNATLFCPKVLYNARTGMWVLWYNLSPPYNYAVAVSPSPYGPFHTVSTTVALTTQYGHLYNNSKVGDFSLFADDDGSAYILYSSDHHVQLEPLTDDYLASAWATTGKTSGVFPKGNEAPALFKRNGLYYALISDSCCYCGQGGQVRAFMATSPLGPYTYTGDITQGPNPFHTSNVTTSSQQTNVFAVGDQRVWQGDRWQSAPPPLRLKGEDYTTMFVLEFARNGSVLPIAWRDYVTVDIPDADEAGQQERSHASTPAFVLSSADVARPFGGVGGISGGGATSRTFFDYPDKQRSVLLDLLWRPQYGASLQHAKVEIPADADTTCGSEVAHRHDAADGGSCTRGYEGWFLQQAAARVPGIATSSLQWAAPRFVGDSDVSEGNSLYTQRNIDEYVVTWLQCMQRSYNVTVTFQGAGWNEKPHNNTYIKLMRQRLDQHGLSHVGIAAADQCCGSNWRIANDMAADPHLAACIDVITTHVAGSLEENTPTPSVALQLGVPLYQGEEHIGLPDPDPVPVWDWAAAASIGIEISQNWVVNNMTATIYWPAVYGWSAGIMYRGKGLLVATCPWGPAPFFVPAALWVVAHTTHFTAADGSWWLLNNTGSGHIGDGVVRPVPSASGGWNVSYVTYVRKGDAACAAPTAQCPFTLVIESFFAGGEWQSERTTAKAPSPAPPAAATFVLEGSLKGWAGKRLYVWHSNKTAQFVQEAPVLVAFDGSFSVLIEPSSIWTFTTVYSAHPGAAALMASLAAEVPGMVVLDAARLPTGPAAAAAEHTVDGASAANTGSAGSGESDDGPADAPFPLPYADDFEGYANDTLPLFTGDMFGAFTVFDVRSEGTGEGRETATWAAGAESEHVRPLRHFHPDAQVRSAVLCSTAEDRALRPSRCVASDAQEPHGPASPSTGTGTSIHNSTLQLRGNTKVLRQWTRAPPIGWGGESSNMATLLGNYSLVNVQVSVAALIETVAANYTPSQMPYVLIGIHGGPGTAGGSNPRAFYRTSPDFDFAWFSADGHWGCSIAGVAACASEHALPGGRTFGYDTWHTLQLGGAVDPGDGSATFSIVFDGVPLVANATVPLAQRKNGGRGGYVGLVTGCHRAQFDNVVVDVAKRG